ncbi:helix-turn-helix domain-containing protein [Streptomyces virginiae]|uniref:helix-turn-helix domain-containing protein n=1 Tax=Streptomyces virginiae TaxID=1961 RepID=UPI00368503DA
MTMYQVLPRQTSRSATKASHRLPSGLPEPAERRRLREQWGLTTQQLSVAFGVTPATVRSWESGRTVPRGPRREAYRLFLAGLAQPGANNPATKPERDPVPVRPAAPAVRRPQQGPDSPPLTPPREARSSQPHRTGATEPPPLPVAPDRGEQVSPERLRRLRLLGAAACVWSLALWVILSCPPPL